MQGNQSEVARIRQQIEDEAYAMYLALDGFACVGRHLIIVHKHRSIEGHRNWQPWSDQNKLRRSR